MAWQPIWPAAQHIFVVVGLLPAEYINVIISKFAINGMKKKRFKIKNHTSVSLDWHRALPRQKDARLENGSDQVEL